MAIARITATTIIIITAMDPQLHRVHQSLLLTTLLLHRWHLRRRPPPQALHLVMLTVFRRMVMSRGMSVGLHRFPQPPRLLPVIQVIDLELQPPSGLVL